MASTRNSFRRLLLSASLLPLPLGALAFGEPDPSFTSTTFTHQFCASSAARPDASLVIPVSLIPSSPVPIDPVYSVARAAASGAIDAGWGTQGLARIAVTPQTTVDIAPRALPLSDGSVLYLREHVTRLDPAGRVDAVYDRNQLADPLSVEGSYALRSDGALAALTTHGHVDPYLGMAYARALTVVRPDGTRDSSFGSAGYVDLGGIGDTIVAWSTYSDGTVQATIETVDSKGQPHLELHRYPVDFDPSAAPHGVIPVNGTASWVDPKVSVDGEGRVYLLDGTHAAGTATAAGVNLYRFLPTAEPDQEFGPGGHVFTPLVQLPAGATGSIDVWPRSLWRTANGGFEVVFVLAEKPPIVSTILSLKLAKLNADGTADASFVQGTALASHATAVVNRLSDGRLAYALNDSGLDCTTRRLLGDPPAEGTMVEYYKASLDHYFMTLEGAESVLLDETAAGAGWKRTGRSFGSWSPSQLEGTRRLCRFYGDLQAGPDSHFYAAEGPECDGLRALDAATPTGQAAWRFEGYAANVAVPVNGACAPSLTPVYRLYNRGFEKGGVPNHRYTTDLAVYADMQAKGWAGEGIAFCVPPAPNNVSS